MQSKKLHTEDEVLDNNRFQISRLLGLYKKDPVLFEEVCSFLPFYVTISSRKNLDVSYFNPILEQWMETPGEEIVSRGFSLIRELSHPGVLDKVVRVINAYEQQDDPSGICSYMQYMCFNGKFVWTLTHKLILDDSTYINSGYRIADFGLPGKFLSNLLGEVIIQKNGWRKLQALTKREREILRFVSQGYTNRQICEQLFISELTIKTHRKNINYKLETKTLADVIRFAHAMEIVSPADVDPKN